MSVASIRPTSQSDLSRTIALCSLIYLLFNLLSAVNHIECQSQASTDQSLTTNPSELSDLVPVSKDTTVVSLLEEPSNSTSDVTLFSTEEFPDAHSVPTVFFDGISNETPLVDRHNNETKVDLVLEDKPKSSDNNSSQIQFNGVVNQTNGTATTSRLELAFSVDSKEPNSTSAMKNETNVPPDDQLEADGDDAEDEDHSSDSTKESASQGSHFEPPQNISQYMDYTEKLFHDLRHQITDLFEPHIPQLIRTSQMVELSNSCSFDMLRLALALRQFEPWALRMIDSSGKVPEGIFEGSFTALGSYDECLNTVFQSASSSTPISAANAPPNLSPASDQGADNGNKQAPTQGKYCLVTLSPFMPPKPPADKVERMFQDEADRRNYTQDNQFSRLSPMFYYMKFRIGVCIPSSCDQNDVESISDALSSSLRLNITIPDCRVKQTNQPLTRPQLIGGTLFALVAAIVLLATLADCFMTKFKRIQNQGIRLRNQVKAGQAVDNYMMANLQDGGGIEKSGDIRIKFRSTSRQCSAIRSEENESQLTRQLDTHWTWMSFSIVTNFRLYFRNAGCDRHHAATPEEQPTHANGHIGSRYIETLQLLKGSQEQTINCLNGIRVLSLCWVIVANSYLTLDPRATKRLAKSREAPRDFLFQLVVQASLAIETFFFLSGLLMSLSFAKRLKSSLSHRATAKGDYSSKKLGEAPILLKWLHFYIHRYVRMTPPTMLVIALSMYAYHLGDGPLWFEATQRVHQSCAQNWWRHLLHVANFIDTRQMCFIHYWYIAADMQLFALAPFVLLALYKCRHIGYALIALISSISIGFVFYMTHERSLPPTLLFYNTDPESRREFGNTIMTKPFAHVLPYLVGMLVGWHLIETKAKSLQKPEPEARLEYTEGDGGRASSWAALGGTIALVVALLELFLPYQWNNSLLPSKLVASAYAALFRLGWSLVLTYIVMSCRHRRGPKCTRGMMSDSKCSKCATLLHSSRSPRTIATKVASAEFCFCSKGGNYINRLLGLQIFANLSKLSFVAYLIHLPLMSVFIGQTRGLFAFSHMLVIHFAISYVVMTFILSFILVHIIEFPFLTFERYLFAGLLRSKETDDKRTDDQYDRPIEFKISQRL